MIIKLQRWAKKVRKNCFDAFPALNDFLETNDVKIEKATGLVTLTFRFVAKRELLKPKYRNRLNVESDLRLNLSSFNLDMDSLVEDKVKNPIALFHIES
ncbi:hypothetical protein AVEN_258875-1 [Araneus ventricosus]|uniref:Uncharacterized protein n=1 Tax=Araneus ventricosus TaxID=182803 RepID=A0A4Y2I6G4_ARAVE|nr:hypothetical protein AVEN_258875-1 [Araneus ventricosus]